LDLKSLSTRLTPGVIQPGYAGVGGVVPAYKASSDKRTTTYNAPLGGTWESTNGGAWTGADGRSVNDLSGYLRMLEQQRTNADTSQYQSGLNTSIASLGSLNADYQSLLKDPSKVQQTAGYQFALDQGNQAINRSAAAKGMLGSGNVLAELAKYGQGMASQRYDKELDNILQGANSAGNQTNTLASLLHGAQNFGVGSNYYNPNSWGSASSGGSVSTQRSAPIQQSNPYQNQNNNPLFSDWAQSVFKSDDEAWNANHPSYANAYV
jgi:hypothetical protein